MTLYINLQIKNIFINIKEKFNFCFKSFLYFTIQTYSFFKLEHSDIRKENAEVINIWKM